ncbi:hypothetical protein ISF_09021 [Cordyceps fumosorosea ARSEF 2679]|uniref:DUF7730 domain-containing protein n=1 Tax=Cordyceps fumosorosea (strain ARSEF 2679) TaxID=1081104 RepID=A0A167LGN3_CORFA|nr:hypothetical protein ISF_09021 [Cordyceps fumosorosea ARSEF 2679]OAA53067.1 hypothetical protein ISF_09021 [Cordyceps fumosorosea ARSEF 2679]
MTAFDLVDNEIMPRNLQLRDLCSRARKRMLFLPPRPIPIPPRRANPQDASPLLRLPPELRLAVWHACFPTQVLHILSTEDGTIRVELCAALADTSDFQGSTHPHDCGATRWGHAHLSLLYTCRRIYSECIDLLYRRTVFDFSRSPRALTRMPGWLPAAHRARIAHVSVGLQFFRPLYLKAKKNTGQREKLWVDVWRALAALEGLEWLHFEMSLGFNYPVLVAEWKGLEASILALVRPVTRPSHFELILPFPADAATEDATLPCTITRRLRPPP